MTSVTDLHFGQWQSGFLPQEYAVISEIVSLLKSNSAKKIVIVGHADNGGEYSKKMEISKKRAEAVKNYLVAAGVSADKIETKYVGDLEPKYLNNRWKLGSTLNFDLKQFKISNAFLSVSRNLHCWDLSFYWTPVGTNKSFLLTIRNTSNLLRDAKLDFRKPPVFL